MGIEWSDPAGSQRLAREIERHDENAVPDGD
jgi:hypothetical protein